MTSPAQLKYLDAMGIPVWIPRDLIIEDTTADLENSAPLNTASKIAPTTSASSILTDLETQTATQAAHLSIPEVLVDTSNPSHVIETLKQSTSTRNSSQVNEIGRTDLRIIYACGSIEADWMVIGESPELINERNNQPYPTDQGELLSNMLKAVGINNPRQEAYLVNTIKRSISANSNQHQEQSDNEVTQLLLKTIELVKPKLVLVVGQIAAQQLLISKEPLARLRNTVHQVGINKTHLIVSYYPSYLLSKPLDKRKAWDDLKLAMRTLN